jgi:hypothetical protein
MATKANGQDGSKPTHVVVTHWISSSGRTVVHTYGPWSRSVCNAERRLLLSRPDSEGTLTVYVCKMLNIRG